METQEQHKKQYDWLKGYQFTKGQSGNPGGRKKGSKSMKVFAREYLENLPEDEKIAFMATLPPELVWKMAEGNPDNKTELNVEKPIVVISGEVSNKYANTSPETNSNGQD